ncbi:MAG TPA: KEOPS complex subunit Cgi121 [Natrialbaceae archaeon]|nr:KEOPS complex subunit Cgi121 [Natrialbaceae archaeon]
MELVEGIATIDDLDAFLERLGDIGDEHDCTIQAFDARYVAGRRHLERALELADRAIGRDDAIADDRAVEVLCYAAGRRQINRALAMGVDEGESPVVVLIAAEEESENDSSDGDEAAAASDVRALLEPADTLGAFDPDTLREFFDVGDAEMAATDASLEDLVIERVALLTVEK